MSYRIGSFNLKNLGQTAMGKEHPRDLAKIAEIIRKEDFGSMINVTETL